VAAGIAVVLLAVGTVSHVVDFVRGGWDPYPWAPTWLNLYWTSLAVLDTVAAVLLLLGRRSGLDLTVAIMVTDLAANAYAVGVVRHADLLGEPGLLRIAAFTAVVLAAVPLLRHRLTTRRRAMA
jgi:hypothetical protein